MNHLMLGDNLVQVTVSGVQHAFSSLFGVTPSVGSHTVQDEFVSKGDISGILGMIQDKVEGTLVVSFQKQTIFNVLEKMYGRPFKDIDNTVKQGVGELTNIIYANVKKHLNEGGHKFKMSIPTVLIGANHSIHNVSNAKTLVIPFEVEGGSFFVEITLQNS